MAVYISQETVRKGSSIKDAVYISQESIRIGSSVKVAVYISQELVRKEVVLKLQCIYHKGQ